MKILALCFLSLLCSAVFSQAKQERSKFNLFPKTKVFPAIQTDPLECQLYGGIHGLTQNGNMEEGVYAPITIGASKAFFSFPIKNKLFEMGFEAASYTQFEIVHIEGNIFKGGLQNNDYKAAGYLSSELGGINYKLNIFHISSHLGDDYMIRNEIQEPNDKSVNYEQIDLLGLKELSNKSLYEGLGYVFSKYAYRKRWMFLTGGQIYMGKPKALYRTFFAGNMKFYEENNFRPDIKLVLGLDLKNAAQIMIEYYNGHLPYSTIHSGIVQWLGIASSIQVF